MLRVTTKLLTGHSKGNFLPYCSCIKVYESYTVTDILSEDLMRLEVTSSTGSSAPGVNLGVWNRCVPLLSFCITRLEHIVVRGGLKTRVC